MSESLTKFYSCVALSIVSNIYPHVMINSGIYIYILHVLLEFLYLQLQSIVQFFFSYEKEIVSDQTRHNFSNSPTERNLKESSLVTLLATISELPFQSNAGELLYPSTVADSQHDSKERLIYEKLGSRQV